MKNEIFEIARQVVELLKQKNLKIATAESCTGGMVSSYLTAVPGASQVFELGITSYSNRIKNELLKVQGKTLEACGAVSRDTAKQMAENVRKISGADIGVSVTGVAGPDSQDGFGAGNVFIGLSNDRSAITKHLKIEPKNREFVREQTVLKLLESVLEFIQ